MQYRNTTPFLLLGLFCLAGASLIYTILLSNRQLPPGETQTAQVAGSVSGLTHYWAFEEGSGGTTADSAGGTTGTLTGGPSWSAGKIGGGLSFSGTGQRVSFGSDPISTA